MWSGTLATFTHLPCAQATALQLATLLPSTHLALLITTAGPLLPAHNLSLLTTKAGPLLAAHDLYCC